MRNPFVTIVLAAIALTSPTGCGSGEDLSGPSKPAADAATDAFDEGEAGSETGSAEAAPDGSEDATEDVQQDVHQDVGPDVGPPACAPPTDPTTAALCLVLEPEVIELVDADERFDGQGLFILQVFDTPEPELPDGTEVPPIAEVTVPDQPGGPTPVTMGVYDALDAVRFEGLPAAVYVRALFVDNFEAFTSEDLSAGVWLGGWDFSQGLFSDEQLLPIALTVGAGTEVAMPMTALRSIKVNLSKSVFAQTAGNGQGPAGFYLFDTMDLTTAPAPWGMGMVDCASVYSPGGIVIEGVFLGDGPYYGFGYLDDFGEGLENDIPPGTMVNLTLASGQISLPATAEIAISPGAYRVEAELELTGMIPFSGLPPVDTMTCP